MKSSPWRKPRSPPLTLCAAALLILILSTFTAPSHATEEPEYQVVRELADIEVRQYAAYIAAGTHSQRNVSGLRDAPSSMRGGGAGSSPPCTRPITSS